VFTRVFSSRFGALGVAAVLAIAAVAVVLVYANNYRHSVNSATGEVTVLVATRPIDQFTPGNQVVDGTMFRTTTVPADARVDGAISNPDQLKGLVAKDNVYPGEQLTTNQFQRSDTTSVAVKLTPDQRAVAFPVDPASGLIGQVQAGDHVDVVATFDVIPVGPTGVPLAGGQPISLTRTIVSDALVLTAPSLGTIGSQGGSNAGRNPVLTLAIGVTDVNHVLFAQQKGTIWFALRPPGTTANVGSNVVDVDSVLRGVAAARTSVLRITGANR
jgi:pilus assembly protein CpaB